jgi:hypothetical protein
MRDEWVVIRKDTVIAYSRYYAGSFMERPGKTAKPSVMVASILAEIGTEHLSNTRLEC